MIITVVKNEFIYSDTDINKVQDEIKAMAAEDARCEDKEFDFCYERELKNYCKALEDYATTLEITMTDVEYALINEFCVEATDIKVGDIKASFVKGRTEIPANEISLNIKEKLMKASFDDVRAFVSLYENCDNLHIEVKACFKNEDGEDDYYWIDFYSEF